MKESGHQNKEENPKQKKITTVTLALIFFNVFGIIK